MARTVKRCGRCQTECTNDHMSLTVRVTDGPTQLAYKPIYVCSEICLTAWADDTIWHADEDPRVRAATDRMRMILDALAIEGRTT